MDDSRRTLPFQTELLASSPPQKPEPPLASLCPVVYRTTTGDLALATPDDEEFLSSELSVKRLDDVYRHLWFAGLPIPPRPLHHQLVLQREIVITEKMDMHLVWDSRRIFLKPIPRYLLSCAFWKAHLHCQNTCGCDKISGPKEQASSRKQESNTTTGQCTIQRRRSIALGFLLSYVALLSHESDFTMARDRGLLPIAGDLPLWADWRRFVKEILSPTIYRDVHRRFYYGELRLGRLNIIYLFTKSGFYMNTWYNYTSFLRDQLGWLAATAVYIAVVLTAMQVGLATNQLKASGSYMAASYGFSVFAIMGPLIAGGFILLALVVVVAINWKFQRMKWAERFKCIQSKGGARV
ncbi:hypothetical protein LTS15_010520 [Exophiala xenobiotica]|nr:hypothetical protein LTS15_010520 [Exophiala xenobiotica]